MRERNSNLYFISFYLFLCGKLGSEVEKFYTYILLRRVDLCGQFGGVLRRVRPFDPPVGHPPEVGVEGGRAGPHHHRAGAAVAAGEDGVADGAHEEGRGRIWGGGGGNSN